MGREARAKPMGICDAGCGRQVPLESLEPVVITSTGDVVLRGCTRCVGDWREQGYLHQKSPLEPRAPCECESCVEHRQLVLEKAVQR